MSNRMMPGVPGLIPGGLKLEDLNQLIELTQDKVVLQLGCYCGRGTVVLSRHARRTWVLDDFCYSDGIQGVVEELRANIDRCAPRDAEVNLLYGTPELWSLPMGAEDLRSEEVEVVYQDADRPSGAKDLDQRFALGLLSRGGGIYAWHDEDRRLRWLQIQPVAVEVN